MVDSVKKVLMDRDGMSEEDADDMIASFKKDLDECRNSGGTLEDAYDLVEDHFGLEPDYLEEFLI